MKTIFNFREPERRMPVTQAAFASLIWGSNR